MIKLRDTDGDDNDGHILQHITERMPVCGNKRTTTWLIPYSRDAAV